MTKNNKNQLINHLNYLKIFGYQYLENIDIYSSQKENFKLPNNLAELEQSANHCYLCDLSKSRKNILFGYGNNTSDIMFISDEPNNTDDELGTFYTGKTGELLKKMIENVLEIKIQDIYFTSLVKCKSNAGIKNSHIETCSSYINKQIELINPKIIVLLGEKVCEYFLKEKGNFSQLRGQEIPYKNRVIIPTFSPSFLLRNPSSKKDAYYDMLRIKNLTVNLY